MNVTKAGHDSTIANAVREFCLRDFAPPGKGLRKTYPSSPVWMNLTRTGTRLWLDTGDIDEARALWTSEFSALTTNNTLLNKEVQKGIYDRLVPEAAKLLRKLEPGIAEHALVMEIAFILNAVHGLKLVSAFEADVSVELHTDLATDAEASYQYGKRYAAIHPDRFIVKVPLTPEGVLAARRLRKDGIRINFTLGFSARQNYLIANVAGPDYVNVFMGRINAFIADNKLGDGKNWGEKATLASQRTMRMLKRNGIEVKQIGASMRNGQQCQDLMGLDVFTMPTAAAKQFLELGVKAFEFKDRTDADPAVTLASGLSAEGEKLDCFWRVDDVMKTIACKLAGMKLDEMTGHQLREVLAAGGAGDLFPRLSAEERSRVEKEGKIPVFESWRRVVGMGSGSWDGLLTEAALGSFAKDQKALDDRIRRLVG